MCYNQLSNDPYDEQFRAMVANMDKDDPSFWEVFQVLCELPAQDKEDAEDEELPSEEMQGEVEGEKEGEDEDEMEGEKNNDEDKENEAPPDYESSDEGEDSDDDLPDLE